MNLDDVKPGIHVKVVKLGDTSAMTIHQKHLRVRRVGITGTVTGFVVGHGMEVCWVKHDGSDQVGAYVFNEFETI